MEYHFKLQKIDVSVVWVLSFNGMQVEETTARVKRTVYNINSIIFIVVCFQCYI